MVSPLEDRIPPGDTLCFPTNSLRTHASAFMNKLCTQLFLKENLPPGLHACSPLPPKIRVSAYSVTGCGPAWTTDTRLWINICWIYPEPQPGHLRKLTAVSRERRPILMDAVTLAMAPCPKTVFRLHPLSMSQEGLPCGSRVLKPPSEWAVTNDQPLKHVTS